MKDEEKEKLKKILDSSHINFLIGSGASMDYLQTLWSIEMLLSESNKQLAINPDNDDELLINYSIKNKYLTDCVAGNLAFLDLNLKPKYTSDKYTYKNLINEWYYSKTIDPINIAKIEFLAIQSELEKTYNNYDKFINALNTILERRKTNVLNSQVNLFTTNMDLFLDAVLENNNLNFNDGFSGRMKPVFSTSNYKKASYQTSSHYDNISEIPTFNLFKLHGSVNWKKEKIDEEEKIVYDPNLLVLNEISKLERSDEILCINDNSSYSSLKEGTQFVFDINEPIVREFLDKYEELIFVNPTKEKFQLTTIDYVFYEQLRMYSNALEKENSVMFVHGFSFADEHIKEITIRAVKSNPTLIIYIFCFNENERQKVQKFFKGTNNVEYICNVEEYDFQKQVDDYLFKLAEEFDTSFWKSEENRKSETEVSTDIEPNEVDDER